MERRIYIASLSHYNNGQLVGKWFEITSDLPELVQGYISSLTCYGQACEEWAIHDDEGFGRLLSEHTGLNDVVSLSEILDEHGDAYIAYCEHVGSDYASSAEFEDSYRGEWKNETDYAEVLIDDLGMLDGMPETLRCYFDYEAFARDLFISDLYSIDNPEGGIFVFSN